MYFVIKYLANSTYGILSLTEKRYEMLNFSWSRTDLQICSCNTHLHSSVRDYGECCLLTDQEDF